MNKEKYIGESALNDKPSKKINLMIRDGSITTSKLADGSVTTEKFANGAVSKEKLDPTIHQEITDSVTASNEAIAKANEAAQKVDDSREQTEQTLGTMQEVIDKTVIKDEEGALVETPFRYIQNEEFIFAKVDAEDKLLFGIHWDGTPEFGKTSAVEDRFSHGFAVVRERRYGATMITILQRQSGETE